MKNLTKLLVIACIGIIVNVQAQELKINQLEEADLSKSSRKGRYAGTYFEDGKFTVLYLTSTKREGVQLDRYQFNSSLKYSDMQDVFVDDAQASQDYVWYMPRSKVEKIDPDNQKFIQGTRAFGGGMKIFLGTLQKQYYMGIYTGETFVEEKKLKPKTGDIWRITPSGFKSTTKIDAITTDNGFYKELPKYGNPLIAPANSPMLAAGIITEKVKTKGPWLTSGNQVAILAIDGENFDDSRYNIYPLPYTAQTLGSGLGQDNLLTVLFAPLNGPTNVKSLKHFLWKDRKNHFTLMRFSDDYELVDSVSFISKLVWGRFQILNGNNSTFVIGTGKASYNGWARNAMGITLKKTEDIQVSKFTDGKLLFSKLYSGDLLKSKLVVPKGDKSKNDFTPPHKEYATQIIALPNGDDLAIFMTGLGYYLLQTSPTGELMAFYRIPRLEKKVTSNLYNYQLQFQGDDLILVMNEQPFEFTNEAQINTSYSRLANSAGTLKTTTIKKLNEVFLQSHIVRINTKNHTIGNRLVIDGKDFYTIGSFPAIFTENAIYFTGRKKGPKGKVISIARIDI